MKHFLAFTLIPFCFFLFSANVQAASPTDTQSLAANTLLKKQTAKGRLPNTIGYVGKYYTNLRKAVPGERINGEGAIFYYSKIDATQYGFLQYHTASGSTKYFIADKEKTQLISKIYRGTLTDFQMQKLYGKAIYLTAYGQKIKLFKSGSFYVGYRSYSLNGIPYTSISVGTKKMMQLAALLNYYR
ncbi:hypothetical protein [Kurthia sibirica]|uniref:Uncharacterized protein n=1 Tax=Kurthia sibirica TaxID=202750 RepID=A0A2U3AIL0_9BACL|nr:hypothetical protein [Kurthia sibirica]PWI24378.1 hypothetical protein DEX24_13660 [Kurthia sibirica]GEK33795.1 hypothetical protein KSI01_13280 [Kurthia sibirica]